MTRALSGSSQFAGGVRGSKGGRILRAGLQVAGPSVVQKLSAVFCRAGSAHPAEHPRQMLLSFEAALRYPITQELRVNRQEARPSKSCRCDRMREMKTQYSPMPAWSKRNIHYRSGPTHAVARARSSAMALSGPDLCADTYLPTAFAISMRHDALARMALLSSNSAINALSTSSSCGRIVPARSTGA
jgi:hypothetical protein